MQKTKTTETRILDLVSSESRFTKFNDAIKAARLTERFSSPNNFTVFAPRTNEAFAKLPQDQLLNLLKPENQDHLEDPAASRCAWRADGRGFAKNRSSEDRGWRGDQS